jgi:hypothetical protein
MDNGKLGGRVAFNIVKGTKLGDYEDGNMVLAWKNLQCKYALTTLPTLLKLQKVYNSEKLQKGKDLDVFITYMEDLRTSLKMMNWEVMETQFMVQILNSLNDNYGRQVESLEKWIKKQGNKALTLEDICEDLNLRYEHLGKKEKRSFKEEEGEDKGETALYTGGKFKGHCHNCRKYGHKGADCNEKKNTKNANGQRYKGGPYQGGFKGKCFNCQKKGHKSFECPEKKDNNRGNANTAEIALMAIEYEGDESVLDVKFES